MIRVGFILATTNREWLGGLIYLSNLLRAIMALEDRRIEPVLIVASDVPDEYLRDFPPVETVRTAIAREGTFLRKLRKVLERGIGRDLVMEAFLRRLKIDVLSHSDQLGARAAVPTMGWLPDFQHRRMPEFFSTEECGARDRGMMRVAKNCTIVVLSSADAQKDLRDFAPGAVVKSRILHFVPGMQSKADPLPAAELRRKYGLEGPFLYLPNQFWVHKNHGIVVEALALLKKRGRDVTVVCTGHTNDARQPAYFDSLMRRVADAGVGDRFKVLGLVPYEDVRGLFAESAAIVNPSFFEGWSTTVEEAKSTGRRLILSDIPVHREQDPPRALFFDPRSPEALAAAMTEALDGYSDEAEAAARTAARQALPGRFRDFARTYQAIAVEGAGRGG